MGEVRLEVICNSDIRTVWPFVRKGLDVVARKCPSEWIVEDIYMMLLTPSSNTALILATQDDAPIGFAVISTHLIFGVRSAHIWALYSADALPETEMIAVCEGGKTMIKDLFGAQKITMASSRPGWRRRAKLFGFAETQTIHECTL